MTDEALRRSQRRWRGGADAEDLARHLLAQVRAGSLPAEAAQVAERLASGETTVEDVLLAGLAGHPWARDVAVEALAERLAYEGRERALDVALEDGPYPTEVLALWLDLLRQARPALLGEALLRVHEHLRAALEALPPPEDVYLDRGRSLELLDGARAALGAWLSAGRPPGEGPDREVWSYDEPPVREAVMAAWRVGALLDERPPGAHAARREWADAILPFLPSHELRAIIGAVLARPMLGESPT
jgi:hypothetical protein